jgi:hypothetical protein
MIKFMGALAQLRNMDGWMGTRNRGVSVAHRVKETYFCFVFVFVTPHMA